MASTLASLCLSHRWTFWTYVMTVNLFYLYLMNFMLHTMLDAAGVILSVYIMKVWNVTVYFHKVAYVHYLGEVDIFHTWVKKFLPIYNSAKIINIDRDFPKLWSQMQAPTATFILWFTVYISYRELTEHWACRPILTLVSAPLLFLTNIRLENCTYIDLCRLHGTAANHDWSSNLHIWARTWRVTSPWRHRCWWSPC